MLPAAAFAALIAFPVANSAIPVYTGAAVSAAAKLESVTVAVPVVVAAVPIPIAFPSRALMLGRPIFGPIIPSVANPSWIHAFVGTASSPRY